MLKIWTDEDPTKRDLPIPFKFDWEYSDLDKGSGRNDYGLMLRERIATKRKITISWNANRDRKAAAEMIRLLKSLPPFVWIQYPDPDGQIHEMKCYRGNIKSSMYQYDPESGSIWRDTSTSFTEQ